MLVTIAKLMQKIIFNTFHHTKIVPYESCNIFSSSFHHNKILLLFKRLRIYLMLEIQQLCIPKIALESSIVCLKLVALVELLASLPSFVCGRSRICP